MLQVTLQLITTLLMIKSCKMREIRMINENIVSPEESRKIEGYALVFNTESNDLGGFNEVIDSRALEGVIEKSDILCLLNHKRTKVY